MNLMVIKGLELLSILALISCANSANQQSEPAAKHQKTSLEVQSLQDQNQERNENQNQENEVLPEEDIFALILPVSEDQGEKLKENLQVIFSLLDGSNQDYQVIEDEENQGLSLVRFRPAGWFKRKKVNPNLPKSPKNVPSTVPSRKSKPIDFSTDRSTPNGVNSNINEILGPYTSGKTRRTGPAQPPNSFRTKNNEVEFSVFNNPRGRGPNEPTRTLFRTELTDPSGSKQVRFVSLERWDEFRPPGSGKTKRFAILANDSRGANYFRKQFDGDVGVVRDGNKYLIFGSITGK